MTRKEIRNVTIIAGIGIGRAHILRPKGLDYTKYSITTNTTSLEIRRFQNAIYESIRQLKQIRDKFSHFQGKEQIEIIDSYILLLQDEMLVKPVSEIIGSQLYNAEWALDEAVAQLKQTFTSVRDPFFQDRLRDIGYVRNRLLRNLIEKNRSDGIHLRYPETIVVTADLSPAEITCLPRSSAKGIILSSGTATSHTAIMARTMEIPTAVGFENAISMVQEGEYLILDGYEEKIIIDPTGQELCDYQKRQQEKNTNLQNLIIHSQKPAITSDNHPINLLANIELYEELPAVLNFGANGIGLYRTEFMFINRLSYPSEDEQFETYKNILQSLAPKAVHIRTLDIGGEKIFAESDYFLHSNPAMGIRAIRLSLKEVGLFETQLRALLRASIYGNLHILFPMISCMEEMWSIKELLKNIQMDLEKNHVAINPDIKIGIMIEVPSAVLIADALAREVDFFSLGTNDLIQYTLAVDRTNEHVSYLFDPLHPAIIKLLKLTVSAAKFAKISLMLCGEMAHDPQALPLLIGLGFDCLSMTPYSIPHVKEHLRSLSFSECQLLAKKALLASSSAEIKALINSA